MPPLATKKNGGGPSEKLALSAQERERWHQLNETVKMGFEAYVETGLALREIHGRKLYREEFGTWEAYCEQVVGMNRTHALRWIESAKIVEKMSPIGDILPSNEAQVRELIPLGSDGLRQQAWAKAVEIARVENRAPTAKVVRAVVVEMRAQHPAGGRATAADAAGLARAGATGHDDHAETVGAAGTAGCAGDIDAGVQAADAERVAPAVAGEAGPAAAGHVDTRVDAEDDAGDGDNDNEDGDGKDDDGDGDGEPLRLAGGVEVPVGDWAGGVFDAEALQRRLDELGVAGNPDSLPRQLLLVGVASMMNRHMGERPGKEGYRDLGAVAGAIKKLLLVCAKPGYYEEG